MAIWHKLLDPFVSVLPTNTPAVQPIMLEIPGVNPSIHVTVYLPTQGRDQDFIIAVADLECIVRSLCENYPDVPIYIRDDANVNSKNLKRCQSMSSFFGKFEFQQQDLFHNTYHHFMGDGASDSQLDVLLFRGPISFMENDI